jgi:hypothetical protein
MSASPVLYQQLRMLAEAALGAASDTANTFYFLPDGTNGPVPLPPGTPAPADVVLVPTSNATRLFPFGGLTMKAGAADPGINLVTDLPRGVQADAAFWTDASVQKFLLPYYASCMGYTASARLASLQRVWNGAWSTKQPYALLHVTGTPQGATAGSPQSVEPIWVVYLEGGVSRAQPLIWFETLPEFGTLPPLPAPPLLPAVPYVQPTGPDGPTYGALRSMAEWSASVSGDVVYFGYDPVRNTFDLTDGPGTGALVIPVQNPAVPAARPTSIEVTLTLSDGSSASIFDWMSYQKDPGETFNQPDAFFWSTGSIEQFMLPYYVSIDGFMGLPDLLSLQDAWQQNAAAYGGEFTGGAPGAFTGPEDGEVLGLVHIPRSLWVTEETAVLGQSLVVHVNEKGTPATTPASQFIARSRRKR